VSIQSECRRHHLFLSVERSLLSTLAPRPGTDQTRRTNTADTLETEEETVFLAGGARLGADMIFTAITEGRKAATQAD